MKPLCEGLTLLFELARIHPSEAFQILNLPLDGWQCSQVSALHHRPRCRAADKAEEKLCLQW